jgi:protocatechuate 3,4-dioxygenase beta subunit
VIRGRVVAADTGLPIRQANVSLTWMQPVTLGSGGDGVIGGVVGGVVGSVPGGVVTTATLQAQGRGRGLMASNVFRPRSTRTDDQGNFEFKALPAGSYRIYASTGQYSAQYLSLGYGGRRTNADPGLPIQLSDGQTFDKATIALPRGAVIAGRVTDDGGEPMARVQVYGLWFPPGSRRGQRNSGGAQTDDLGQFRLFGLQPGDYLVVAEARMPTYVNPDAILSDAEEDRSGFLTTFYPGTPDEGAAQRVRTRAGAESGGIDIRMVKGHLYRIAGTVMDSQGNPAVGVNGELRPKTATTGMGVVGGFTTGEQGRFQMQNLPPGAYRLILRQQPPNFGPNGPEGAQGEMAQVPITLAGTDLENLMIVMTPGVTVTGHVEFEQGPPESPIAQMRVSAIPGEPDFPMFGPSPNTTVRKDLTFKLQGLSGETLIRGGGGLPPPYYVKAVLVGGADVTDIPREFKAQDHVTLLVSSRGATLEGTVTDAKGTPTSDAGIIVFPENKASWHASSTRVRRSSPDAQGRYRISPMHPGRYFIVATDRGRLNTFQGTDYAAFYDELSKDATTLIINEDETRTVDLKVVTSGGDR